MNGVRLDKWLWAARFFKTRGLAREAINGGKIYVDGIKGKPSKLVIPGLLIQVSRGQEIITAKVLGVREDRRPAKEAVLLYQETSDSILKRSAEQDIRRFAIQGFQPKDHRPNKRERRQITKLKGIFQ